MSIAEICWPLVSTGNPNWVRIEFSFRMALSPIGAYRFWNEDVMRARDMIEYVHDEFVVKPEDLSWVVGKRWETMNDIIAKTGIIRADWNEDAQCINLFGLRAGVEDAQFMLETHVQYRDVYSQMDKEMEQLDGAMDELRMGGSKTGGGKKGGGKR